MRYTAAHWGAYTIGTDTEDGNTELRPVAGDPAPSRIGRGWMSAARDPKSRILEPAVRKGWLDGDRGAARNADSFVAVGWDRAVELVAGELDRVRGAHGNGAIFGGSYGWASAGRFHHAQSQLRRLLNLAGGCVTSRDTYSHAAAEVLLPHITGMTNRAFQDQMTSWPLVAEHCELLVAFGGISERTAQITSSGTSRHEVTGWLDTAARRGMAVINVSPQRSDMAATPSAEWLSIRPGTDTALMLALCHELLIGKLHDQAFVDRYTSGWDSFRDYLLGGTDGQPKSADWAASLCAMAADDIRALAARLSQKKTMIAVNWGLQRAHHGEQPLWAGLALAAMLGGIGRPGEGFAFGYGSTTPVGRPSRLIGWPSVLQGSNPVSDFIPVARIADMLLEPGGAYDYDGAKRTYPDIRLVWWAGGNPFHHHQDLNRLEEAWTRPETVIVNDHAWTATARRADIVLPATTALERHDIMINRRDPSLIYMSPAMDPMGAALDDHEILRRIAARLGVEPAFTEGRSTKDWLRHLWDRSRQVAAEWGHELPDFETFCEVGRFDLPDDDAPRIQFGEFVADPDKMPLATDSGRITLFNPTIAAMKLDDCPGHPVWRQPAESLIDADDDELHLISGQPATRLHGQLDRGAEAQADKIDGREPCVMHPETAARRGIADGDIVRLFNGRGACLAGARLSTDIRRDCVALATGAWFDPQTIDGQRLEVHGNPNVLTLDRGASGLSQGNIAHTALVRVEKWDKPLPPLSVDRLPTIASGG
ncbi:MAG: molybdopterin-dependent oxidoreductase [Roseitalea sp.]|jgi:biotin/methionine sulfoxide reductase|nr:molybdopterin-dependent oxidoreductase [Roseitalea sp.]MBO6722942.1 molybdopterin-dependent oxidoreductase [Roseitalea sp.]MBO6743592.1 molybdopterin-dependent oxidoreductase [Roseitalea sp.]